MKKIIYHNSNLNMPTFANDLYLQGVISLYRDNKPIITNDIVKYFNDKQISVGSKVSQISSFKKILKGIRDDPVLSELRMPSDIRSENKRNQIANKIIAATKHHDIPLAKQKEILAFIKSNEPSELYSALLLVSGRRPRELYLMARNGITKTGKRDLLFKEQVKQRHDFENYNVPLLVSFTQFHDALERFKLLSGDIPEFSIDIYNKFKKRNAYYISHINKQLDISLNSNDIRQMYAKLAFDYAKRKGYKLSFDQYTKEIFGREVD